MTRTLFLVGFLSLLAQVVLLRELNVAFYGIELAYLVALAAWMAGTAAGAAIGGIAHASSPALLLLLASLALPLDVAFVRGSRILFGAVPGAYLPIEGQLLALLLAVTPIAALFGLAFTLAAERHAASGGRVSAAYAIECAGAAVAGLAATAAFRLGAQNFAVAIAVATAGAAALSRSRWGRAPAWPGSQTWRFAPHLVLALGLLAAWQSGPLDARLTRWNHPTLVDTRDTPYARVTLTRAGAQVAVFENDVLAHDSESVANEELPHLAALQRPTASRILLLGGAAELMDGALARHRPALLHHVEMDRAMVDGVRRLLPLAGAPEIADPRSVLSRPDEYDLIVVATGGPVSGQSNRLYTREFFGACARRLAPAGVLALRLDVPPNYLGPAALLRAASVARALQSTFRHVDFLPASRAVALGSNSPLPPPDIVAARIGERSLQTQLVTAAYVDYLYTNDRREELRTAFATTIVPENRDRQPVAYLYAAASWLSKFWPGLIGADWARAVDPDTWPRGWRWGVPAAIVLALVACRLRPGSRRAALALVAGLAGMVLETIVLLHYQATHGALFEDLGVLMMAFMAGSAAGAWLSPRAEAWLTTPLGMSLPGAVWLTGLAGWGLLSWWLVSSGTAVGMLGATAALAGVGATVGGLFAAASERRPEALHFSKIDGSGAGPRVPSNAGSIGGVYAADVLGGCLGSLAASLVLVPLAGMGVAALTVSGLAAASLVLAVSPRIRR